MFVQTFGPMYQTAVMSFANAGETYANAAAAAEAAWVAQLSPAALTRQTPWPRPPRPRR